MPTCSRYSVAPKLTSTVNFLTKATWSILAWNICFFLLCLRCVCNISVTFCSLFCVLYTFTYLICGFVNLSFMNMIYHVTSFVLNDIYSPRRTFHHICVINYLTLEMTQVALYIVKRYHTI